MHRRLVPLSFAGLIVALVAGCASEPAPEGSAAAWASVPEPAPHVDHSTFFTGPFETGPEVTQACMECHRDEAFDVMKTQHFQWLGDEVVVPGHEEPTRIGKKNVINNFCIGVTSNWAACTTCHAGYGWEDESFDFEEPTNVDCLVCHDNSGTYMKKGKGAGLPDPSVDLLEVAKSVGRPTRANCGACHFNGGGGNAVKHGDLDDSLMNPTERVDVHMGRHDLTCVDCHQANDHEIPGRSISVSVSDTNRVACTECHAEKPHGDDRLNKHTARVACQTCHIPHMAVEEPTKMTWDWSEAGQDLDIKDKHVYMKIKGRFQYGHEVEPEYYWYNGTSSRYLLGDKIDPETPTKIAAPLGDRSDPKARIWPFKVHRGKQPYDAQHDYFMVPNVHGPEGYWSIFDWDIALRNGAKKTGLDYSGEYGFAPTEMYWPLSHMVSTKDRALQCQDCHGERGRLDWQALGYKKDPLGRESLEHMAVPLLDADGEPAVETGKPLSTTQTCAQCHDTEGEDFLHMHGYHKGLDLASLPPARAELLSNGPRLPGESGEEMNCLLCHTTDADHEARMAALRSGAAAWSVAATVPGLVQQGEDGWTYDAEKTGEGEVDLGISLVEPSACGACHGTVHVGRDPFTTDFGRDDAWTTRRTGQVFSGQRVALSGLNIQGKDGMRRPWDVHAERLVTCGDCHYSTERPERLEGEAAVSATGEERRRCESCHTTEGTHEWLPETDRHFAAVACESCHASQLVLPALEQVDATVVRADGSHPERWRSSQADPSQGPGALIGGYEPVFLPAASGSGAGKITPHNLVSEWFWVDGQGERVPADVLKKAWLDGGSYRPALLQAFDTNHDGALSEAELRLDAKEKTAAVAKQLTALGIQGARVEGEVRAYAIHHGVAFGEFARKSCDTCHAKNGSKPAAFGLAEYLPAAVEPTPVGAAAEATKDAWRRNAQGGLEYAPALKPAEARKNGGKEK